MTAAFKPELYDQIAPGYYDEVYARGRGVQWFWHHHRFRVVSELLAPAGGSILDLGCGPGTFLGHFTAGYDRAVGIDLARPQIEYASHKYGSDRVRFEAATVAAFTHAEKFDAVVSIEVIEHLPPEETQRFLRSIFEALKRGGTLVLTTPNYRSLWPLIEWAVSAKGPVDYRQQHINRFDARRLVRELETAGFTIRRTRTFFVLAPFLAAIATPLAERIHTWEHRLLPHLGAELAIRAEKP